LLTSICNMYRDVFNEKPSTEVAQLEEGGEDDDHPDALPRGAVIHTTRGDISVKLFPGECPRTVENFATHAREGYYSGVLFHRVIKGFCIQTGDPLGRFLGPSLLGIQGSVNLAFKLDHCLQS